MITLYGAPTTNTHKVAIALEELGLKFESRYVSLARKEQKEDWFLKLAPNNKFPVLSDASTGITIWESGAILIYLADTYDTQGLILPKSGARRYAALQAAFFQAAHIGPNLGRLNDQITASDEDKIPGMQELFQTEAMRLIVVLERMLGDGRAFVAGEYSIADIMHYPWLKVAMERGFSALLSKPLIPEWLDRITDRPAVTHGMQGFSEHA